MTSATERGPLVSVVVVTWNCREHVLRCLDAVYGTRGGGLEVIVRDNGSTDGTRAAIADRYPEARLITDGRNVGFAAASNEAIAHAAGRYVLLLNPDAEVGASSVRELVDAAKRHEDRALVVPTLLNRDGTVQPSCHGFPTFGGILRRCGREITRAGSTGAGDVRVDWAIGACWLLPRLVHGAVGPLDEGFFMYGEDLDYCWRLRAAGFRVVWTSRTRVAHVGNVSGARMWGEARSFKTYEALVRFWFKHFSAPYVAAMMLARMAAIAAGAVAEALRAVGRLVTGRAPRVDGERLRLGLVFGRACIAGGVGRWRAGTGRARA